MKVGIHDLEVATSHYVLELDTLAEAQGIDPNKFRIGLGQDRFSIPAPDEDAITMASHATKLLLERNDASKVRQVLFATESSVDQSKAAGVFVHGLLNMPRNVRTVEVKQACYSGTAALQMAVNHVHRFPEEQVLVIASDVARYALDSAGEPTQGAGAVAMLIAAEPNLIALDDESGFYTFDVNDFWRPNDTSTPFVDGQLSLDAYIDAVIGAWEDYAERTGATIDQIHRFLHHQPFTKMARKAHQALGAHLSVELGDELIEESMSYNRSLGNTYTASLYFGLLAQLHNNPDLAGKRLGFLSYGSGAVSEFFTGVVQPGYTEHLDTTNITNQLETRTPLDYAQYRDLHNSLNSTSENFHTDRVTKAPFRFVGVEDHQRRYETL